jgi:hypothetical protein
LIIAGSQTTATLFSGDKGAAIKHRDQNLTFFTNSNPSFLAYIQQKDLSFPPSPIPTCDLESFKLFNCPVVDMEN